MPTIAEQMRELREEIETLKLERKGLKKQLSLSMTADNFRATTAKGESHSFSSNANMQKNMEIGDVWEAQTFKTIEDKTFAVKINKHRVDFCDTRLQAEGLAMLHGV